MPTIAPAFEVPAPITVIACTEFCGNPFDVGPDGRFHCLCGNAISPRDRELGPEDCWGMTSSGMLAYVTAPAVALRRYREARAVMDDRGACGPELEAAHAEFRTALAELDAARYLGLPFPEDTPVEIGRVYLAAVVNPDGTYGGGNPHALGWDCTVCAPRATDPSRQESHPCRNPRGHAWSTVDDWRRHADRRRTHTYKVLSPIAPDLPAARERAAELLIRRATAAAPA